MTRSKRWSNTAVLLLVLLLVLDLGLQISDQVNS